MDPTVPLMLGLVCLLERRTWAKQGSPPQPSIWAEPGAVVPEGSSVSIFCRIPAGVKELRLFSADHLGVWYDKAPQGAQEVAEFSFSNVTWRKAATYYCEYFDQHTWTGRSDALELVVTGIYQDKPSLTAHPGPQVAPGGNVTLHCHTPRASGSFILCRGGGASIPQDCSRQRHDTFLVSSMSLTDRATYRCYVCGVQLPLTCSQPSGPLELWVPGLPDAIVIGVSAAAVSLLLLLLLLLLVVCLCRRQAKRRSTNDGTKNQVKYKSSGPAADGQDGNKCDDLEDRQMDTQVSAAEDPQEVTYAQLHPDTFRGGLEPLPPRGPEDPSAQTCVYASLSVD